MTTEWVVNNLPVEDGKVILNISNFGGVYCIDVEILADLFADVEPTYENLLAFNEANDLGFKPYLDVWKQKGILS